MNTLLFKLVATNSGWIARNILKVSTVLTAAVAAFLIGKGVDGNMSTIIAAGAGSAFLWLVEVSLSFIARKYSVTDSVKPVLDAIRRSVPVVAILLLCPLFFSCQGGKFLGLDQKQWVTVIAETGKELGKEAIPVATKEYTKQRFTSAKQPVDVLPEVTVEPVQANTGWLGTILNFLAE